MEKGKYTCGIFIDLKKAFDTVNHDILLCILHHYGIRGVFHDWFRSYLSSRKQTVCINGSILNSELTPCGIPQGRLLLVLEATYKLYFAESKQICRDNSQTETFYSTPAPSNNLQDLNKSLLELWYLHLGINAKTHFKRVLRLIHFSNLREHAVPHFIKARSLPLNFIYFERMCHMRHDIYNKAATNNLIYLN